MLHARLIPLKEKQSKCGQPTCLRRVRAVLFLSGATKEALMSELSDMDYLRSKVASTDDGVKGSKEKSEHEDDDAEEDGGAAQHPDSAYESGENSSKAKSSKNKMHSKDKKSAQQEVNVRRRPSHEWSH